MSYDRDLQTLRVALDLDLREAASLCKMSNVVYGEWERGIYPMDAVQFAELVHALLRPTRERMQASATEFRKKITAVMRRR